MLLKICGITRLADAQEAVEAGATALGFVFWPESPRFIRPTDASTIVGAIDSDVLTVGVFVDEPIDRVKRALHESGVSCAQLHGSESPAYARAIGAPVLKVITIANAEDECSRWPDDTTFLLDAHDPVRRGGTGQLVPLDRAAAIARAYRIVLAGGLTPDNVAKVIAAVRPYGVDVASGVESAPGVKDHTKLRRFIDNARGAL